MRLIKQKRGYHGSWVGITFCNYKSTYTEQTMAHTLTLIYANTVYSVQYTKLTFTSLNKAPPVIITNVFFGVMKQPINIFSLLHKDIPPMPLTASDCSYL